MKLSIIIVNWNTKDFLKKCLDSILLCKKDFDYEIIIVDNSSTDQSQKIIENYKLKAENLKTILNEKNLGFAKAVNQGIKLSKGEYILILNPDTTLKEDTLEKIVDFMEKNQSCGILGGKILNPDGTIQLSVRKFPNLCSQVLILLKIHHFLLKIRCLRNYFALDFDYSKTQEVDQVMGSFFLIRSKVIKEIGLFDEKFFLWFEEVDFCKRAKNKGWKIYYYPQAEIFHQKAGSFSQVFPLKNQWRFNKSLLYYFKKHHSFLAWLILVFLQPISLILSLIISLLPFLKKLKKL